MDHIAVITIHGQISFYGKHREDLDLKVNNWHYYEDEHGKILHFRKEYMIAVLEGKDYVS